VAGLPGFEPGPDGLTVRRAAITLQAIAVYSMTVTIRRRQSENLEGYHYPNGA
jgi:hypothetical protein